MDAYTKPLPVIDELTRPYWELARQHLLSVQRCNACGHPQFPPGPVCPQCLSPDLSWQVVSGRGQLLTWAEFHRAYWKSFAEDLPYSVCVVQLQEGPIVVSNLVGPLPPLRRGLPLQAVFEDVTPTLSLVRFRAVTE